jgi:LPS sulfotransferase NodH
LLDVQYQDLMQDPAGTVGRIYHHFGMDNADEARSRMEDWQKQHPQTKFGVHRYRAEDYGLDAKRLRERFAFYTRRFDVPAESPT